MSQLSPLSPTLQTTTLAGCNASAQADALRLASEWHFISVEVTITSGTVTDDADGGDEDDTNSNRNLSRPFS